MVGDVMGQKKQSRRVSCWVVLLGLLGGGTDAFGWDDAPVRTARLSFLTGRVTVERADNTGGSAAQINMPMPEGTRVVTAEDGQAEVEFEDGSLVRLTPNSAVVLTSLATDADGGYKTQVDVLHGLFYAELRSATRYRYVVSAGADAISPVTNATVRIAMDHPPTVIAVLDGSVRVVSGADAGGGYRIDLRAGESLSDDTADRSRYMLTQGVEKQSWDQWNEERDQTASNEASTRTTARDGYAGDQGYGWSDLDANGAWYNVQGQGEVWQPNVAAGGAAFDPYGYGSWVGFGGSGYVFSSGYAWGWTPYRCGNWSYYGGFGWGWAPGSACGVSGWRRGGGNPVNIVQGPPNYHRPHAPLQGPGVPPIVPVHPGALHDGSIVAGTLGQRNDGSIHTGALHDGSIGSGLVSNGPVTIGGQTATRLPTLGSGYTQRGGSAVGWSLRRDYPVNRGTGQAVLGTESDAGPVVPGTGSMRGGWVSAAPRPAGGVSSGGVIQPSRPVMRAPMPGTTWPTARPGTIPNGVAPNGVAPNGVAPAGGAPTRSQPVQPVRSMPPQMIRPSGPVGGGAPTRSTPVAPAAPAAPAAPHR